MSTVNRRRSIRMSRPRVANNTINGSNATQIRVHRKELWIEAVDPGLGSTSFVDGNYPVWFNALSRLYETYRMHSVRIHWTSGYSKFVGGYTYVSYNTNHSQTDLEFTPQTIFAQQNAGRSKVADNGSFEIPSSAWTQQPVRRQCSGPNSFLFDLRYYIQAFSQDETAPRGNITFWIEYDCTFYTPQIEVAAIHYSDLENAQSDTRLNIATNADGSKTYSIDNFPQPVYLGYSVRPGVDCVLTTSGIQLGTNNVSSGRDAVSVGGGNLWINGEIKTPQSSDGYTFFDPSRFLVKIEPVNGTIRFTLRGDPLFVTLDSY